MRYFPPAVLAFLPIAMVCPPAVGQAVTGYGPGCRRRDHSITLPSMMALIVPRRWIRGGSAEAVQTADAFATSRFIFSDASRSNADESSLSFNSNSRRSSRSKPEINGSHAFTIC